MKFEKAINDIKIAKGLVADDEKEFPIEEGAPAQQSLTTRVFNQVRGSMGGVSYFVKLRRLLKRERVGVVHAQQCLDAVYARIACVGTGIKVVQTFHGYDFNAGKLMRRFMRFSAHWVDANFFVSASQRDYYIKSYQLKDHHKQHVVYNGVNFDKLDQQVAQVDLPIGGDPALQGLKLAMVGNFVRGREQNTVCQFLKLLKEAGVPFDFYFVGRKSESEPWLYDDCVAYCQEHQLLNCVHSLGVS